MSKTIRRAAWLSLKGDLSYLDEGETHLEHLSDDLEAARAEFDRRMEDGWLTLGESVGGAAVVYGLRDSVLRNKSHINEYFQEQNLDLDARIMIEYSDPAEYTDSVGYRFWEGTFSEWLDYGEYIPRATSGYLSELIPPRRRPTWFEVGTTRRRPIWIQRYRRWK